MTDPLDDKVKERIMGSNRLYNPVYISSGSEHSCQHDDVEEDDAPCLSNLLCGFLDELDSVAEENDVSDLEHDSDCQMYNDDFEILKQAIIDESADQYRNILLGQVLKAIETFWFVKSNGSLLRRNVMAFLRSGGYNAGICKTKWESSGGLTAGNYEFIDVHQSDDPKSCRYFIDLNFISEFEIARRTSQYQRLVRTLPSVFIGKSHNLKQIVKIMSNGSRRSLKSQGLHLPPWRKNRFMQSKWFGKYRRTVNLVPVNSYSLVKESVVKCRTVGFDAVKVILATTRTR